MCVANAEGTFVTECLAEGRNQKHRVFGRSCGECFWFCPMAHLPMLDHPFPDAVELSPVASQSAIVHELDENEP